MLSAAAAAAASLLLRITGGTLTLCRYVTALRQPISGRADSDVTSRCDQRGSAVYFASVGAWSPRS